MKKIKIIARVVLCLGIVSVSTAAKAADITKEGSANVEISGADTPVTPDPVEPYPPTGPMEPVGALGISSATDLYFDSIALSTSTAERDALYVNYDSATGTTTPISNVGTPLPTVATDGTALVPGFSVVDRRGTGEGWNLQLSLGDFVEQGASGTAHTLKGAQLVFPVVTPITNTSTTAAETPVTLGATLNAGSTAYSTLMNASTDQGKGLWEARYNSRIITDSDTQTNPIVLKVPSDNYAGSYKAVLKWNLVASPAVTPAP